MSSTVAGPYRDVPLRRLLSKLDRPTREHDGVVTAFRDGEVTLRTSRREDGFTMSADDAGYQGVELGDLVVHGLDAFAGAVGVSNARGKCSPVYHVCRANEGIDARYIAWALRGLAQAGFLELQAGNVRQRAVDFRNWQTLASIQVPLPAPHEQRAIADFLDAETARIDAMISIRRRQISLVKEAAHSRLVEAILRGSDPVRGQGRLPDDWERPLLGVLIELHRGVDLPVDQRVEGPVPVISSGGVSGSHSVAAARGPGVVTGRYGTIGEVFYVETEFWPLNTTLFVSDFRGNHPRWVYHLLRAMPLAFDADKTAVTGINRNVVGELRAVRPRVAEQRELAEHLDRLEERTAEATALLANQVRLLLERREALVGSALTGDLAKGWAAA